MADLSLEKKYEHAVLVLSAIANRKPPYIEDELVQAYYDCNNAAEEALKYLGEKNRFVMKPKYSTFIGPTPVQVIPPPPDSFLGKWEAAKKERA